jgi:hypothetical protein
LYSRGVWFESQMGHRLSCDWDFSWFHSIPPGKCTDNTWTMPQPLPYKSFPICHFFFSSCHLMLCALDADIAKWPLKSQWAWQKSNSESLGDFL